MYGTRAANRIIISTNKTQLTMVWHQPSSLDETGCPHCKDQSSSWHTTRCLLSSTQQVGGVNNMVEHMMSFARLSPPFFHSCVVIPGPYPFVQTEHEPARPGSSSYENNAIFQRGPYGVVHFYTPSSGPRNPLI